MLRDKPYTTAALKLSDLQIVVCLFLLYAFLSFLCSVIYRYYQRKENENNRVLSNVRAWVFFWSILAGSNAISSNLIGHRAFREAPLQPEGHLQSLLRASVLFFRAKIQNSSPFSQLTLKDKFSKVLLYSHLNDKNDRGMWIFKRLIQSCESVSQLIVVCLC